MTTPIRTSRADRNYLSYSGDTVQLYMGTPEARSIQPPYPMDMLPTDPQSWDAVLKVSSNDNAVSLVSTPDAPVRIAQGRENAIDCNNLAGDVTIRGEIGYGGGEGDQVVTIKGGSSDITISGTIHSRGRDCDVELGMWSDQSTDPVHHLDLVGLKRADGRPVTVIIVRADMRTIALPEGAKVLQLKSALAVAYWWAKRAYVAILSLFRRSAA